MAEQTHGCTLRLQVQATPKAFIEAVRNILEDDPPAPIETALGRMYIIGPPTVDMEGKPAELVSWAVPPTVEIGKPIYVRIDACTVRTLPDGSLTTLPAPDAIAEPIVFTIRPAQYGLLVQAECLGEEVQPALLDLLDKAKELLEPQQAAAVAAQGVAAIKPWDGIPHEQDKALVRMLWEGCSSPRIAQRLCLSPKRVDNRLSELRRDLGSAVVPTREDLRQSKSRESSG